MAARKLYPVLNISGEIPLVHLPPHCDKPMINAITMWVGESNLFKNPKERITGEQLVQNFMAFCSHNKISWYQGTLTAGQVRVLFTVLSPMGIFYRADGNRGIVTTRPLNSDDYNMPYQRHEEPVILSHYKVVKPIIYSVIPALPNVLEHVPSQADSHNAKPVFEVSASHGMFVVAT